MAVIAPEAIAGNGWQFYEKCRCKKILTYVYRNPAHPDLELRWQVNNFMFKIMNKNTTKVPLTPLAKMDEILKSL